jgi:hypothetical protein
MKTKIEKTKKQREQSCILSGRRGKRKREKTTSNNLTTICRDAAHHVKENMVAQPKRRQKIRFGHQVVSNMPPKWRECHSLIGACLACESNFFIKKNLKVKVKIPKHSS